VAHRPLDVSGKFPKGHPFCLSPCMRLKISLREAGAIHRSRHAPPARGGGKPAQTPSLKDIRGHQCSDCGQRTGEHS
jgi:hypothetical protein